MRSVECVTLNPDCELVNARMLLGQSGCLTFSCSWVKVGGYMTIILGQGGRVHDNYPWSGLAGT